MTWRFPALPEDIKSGLLVRRLNDKLADLSQKLLQPETQYELRYGTTVPIDVSGKIIAKPRVTVNDTNNFTIGLPVGSQTGGLMILQISNILSGPIGSISFAAGYSLSESLPSPGAESRVFIVFECIDTSPAVVWCEVARSYVGTGGGGSGEVNTASNVNAGGVGVFKQKAGVNLEMRGVNAGSPKVTVTLDTPNNEIDVDVVTGTIANSVCVGNDSRLSDSRPPNGAAGGVLSGTYPSPGFAVDMATQAELDAAVTALVTSAGPGLVKAAGEFRVKYGRSFMLMGA